ncbi:MAG: hypothetical protein JW943_08770 [Deltaproteobacteria bacterium]|nr:hypothetical protein [Deltaproteobacteria bacterium]
MKTYMMKRGEAGREENGTGPFADAGNRRSINILLRRLVIGLIFLSMLFSVPMSFGAKENKKGQDPRLLQITADLAAGLDLAAIIKNAVAAGLPVEEVTKWMVKAGTDPGRVVYAAITANFPAESVVKGVCEAVNEMLLSAAAHQSAVNAIVSAVIQAGVPQSQVAHACRSCGTPEVIANALVYGYSEPPGPPICVGPGCNPVPPPPPGPASPYKP